MVTDLVLTASKIFATGFFLTGACRDMETRAADQAAARDCIMKVKVFVVEFDQNGKRQWYPESMSSNVAYAFGRQLAKLGRKPIIRRIELPLDRLEQLLRDYESLR